MFEWISPFVEQWKNRQSSIFYSALNNRAHIALKWMRIKKKEKKKNGKRKMLINKWYGIKLWANNFKVNVFIGDQSLNVHDVYIRKWKCVLHSSFHISHFTSSFVVKHTYSIQIFFFFFSYLFSAFFFCFKPSLNFHMILVYMQLSCWVVFIVLILFSPVSSALTSFFHLMREKNIVSSIFANIVKLAFEVSWEAF